MLQGRTFRSILSPPPKHSLRQPGHVRSFPHLPGTIWFPAPCRQNPICLWLLSFQLPAPPASLSAGGGFARTPLDSRAQSPPCIVPTWFWQEPRAHLPQKSSCPCSNSSPSPASSLPGSQTTRPCEMDTHQSGRGHRGSSRPVKWNKADLKSCLHSLFRLNPRKNFFPLRVTEPWPRLPSEVVESPSLEIFQTRLDKVLYSLL